jgi:uncharacterized protein YukE
MACTTVDELAELADLLGREAERIDDVRERLRTQVAATHGRWEGLVADRFRGHAGANHRQHHLALARDRLRHAAKLARLVAQHRRDQGSATGGVAAPSAALLAAHGLATHG